MMHAFILKSKVIEMEFKGSCTCSVSAGIPACVLQFSRWCCLRNEILMQKHPAAHAHLL